MINWRSNYAFTLHREDNSRWSEAKLILGSFLIILLVGTLFLVQPSSHKGEVTVINALFTATSATETSTCFGMKPPMPYTDINSACTCARKIGRASCSVC
jgi:hypothetical protein